MSDRIEVRPVTTDDLYADARLIADRLDAAGWRDQARAVRDAMDGATGTEIFMRLRFHLSRVREAPAMDGATGRLVDALVAKLSEALT